MSADYFFSNLKYKVLAAVFVVVMVVSYFSLNRETSVPAMTTMQAASLPVIMMRTQEGTLFNELHGYTSEVDAYLINESVTPLQENRNLNVVINPYGEQINKLSYKIRKMSDMSLVEDTTVSDYNQSDGSIYAVFKIKNLIENDTEYLMEINIETAGHELISYYTKVFCTQGLDVQEKLNFVMNFNGWTFSDTQLDNISKYIETKSTGDNTNYGKVNINSTKAQIGWGSLKPFVEQTIIPSIKEISSEIASVNLEYKMAAQADNGNYDSYMVNEYYRIRQSGDNMYLLNFEREADQIFDSRDDLMSSSRINLGISSSHSAVITNSENNKYTCFVRQGNLWCFDAESNTFIRAFSFDDESSDNIRESYDCHDIKVMEIDNDGNIDFIVYGYMNRGEHEGQVGVSLCEYSSKDNLVKERIYIPVDVTYEVLSENIGKIAYIGVNGAFYILVDDTLYSIDLTSKEKMTEISGLTDETYAVSEDGTAIAYSLNGELYNTDTIRIFNMATGNDLQIKARTGDRIRVIGYIKNDFVYGMAHADDIVYYRNGSVLFPMYRIEIMDASNALIKEYEKDGIYVSDAEVTGMRLNLTRVLKNDDGDYEAATVDQLLNRDENVQDNGAYVEVVATQNRKKELYIDLVNKVGNIQNTSMKAAASVQFSEGEIIRVDAQFTEEGRFYVYGYGKFQGSFNTISRAVSTANQAYGTVYDSNSRCVWRRYKQTAAQVKGIDGHLHASADSFAGSIDILLATAGVSSDAASAFAEGRSAIDIIEDNEGIDALALNGVTLDNVLYYISNATPVIGRYGADAYVLVLAYDSKNVTLYDTSSGREITQTIGEASKIFAQWGNQFITYAR